MLQKKHNDLNEEFQLQLENYKKEYDSKLKYKEDEKLNNRKNFELELEDKIKIMEEQKKSDIENLKKSHEFLESQLKH